MGDSGALRARRARAHKRGDHSLCRPGACADAATDVATDVAAVTEGVTSTVAQPVTAVVTSPVGDDRVAGGIETATAAFVESLGFPEGDPRALLGQIAVLLAQRVDETGAVPAAVRELRVLLSQLAEVPGQPAGKLDELQVQRAQRRLDQILGALAA